MPDYMYMLESRLSPEQYAALVRIQEIAAAAGTNIYLVGGAVRDLISGMPIRDLDFAVEGNPTRIVRDLEKGGAQTISENESLRQAELLLGGDVDVSLAAARDEVYARPGNRPDIQFSTITQDLRRRDFSINAIAISLNPQSRGLLLDPANGLADLERREVRALSIHSFTNQPVRLLRALRYATRMGFTMETRTADWFRLAIERGLKDSISEEDAGSEFRQVVREDRPAAILKDWESNGLLHVFDPTIAKRHPDYEALQRITRVREDMWSAGLRPRLTAAVTLASLGRLKSGEQKSLLAHLGFRKIDISAVEDLEGEATKTAKLLAGQKLALPREAYFFIEKMPLVIMAHILAESSNSGAVGKIRNYLNKWKPLRQGLPAAAVELENLGLERGPKFDKVLEDFFLAQLAGKARKPEDRPKILRKLAGIKELPKKVEKEEKKKAEKGKGKSERKGTSGGQPAESGEPKSSASTQAAAGKSNTKAVPVASGQSAQNPPTAQSKVARKKPAPAKLSRMKK
jgi:tRNA nucleotidyltransferase (CCA-adding enzyme)